MAGKRARAHQDLRHFEGGITAGKDLRVGSKDGSRIQPSIMQMLFKGGSANRQLAIDDMRMGRNENTRPGTERMLSRGGRALATEDIRDDEPDDEYNEPDDEEMLYEGGELDDGSDDVSEEALCAAEDIMDALRGGSYVEQTSEHDSKADRAGKEASKRARTMVFAKALRSFCTLVDED